MSAATETPVVNEPHVGSHGGYVDAAENYTKHHSGAAETAAAPTTEPPASSTLADSSSNATPVGTTAEEPVGKKEIEVTAAPITSGVLGYKAPGPLAFRFKKHHVWLGDEAVPTKELDGYLRGEKPETAHPIAAHASQTGKGLLFIAKDEQAKKTPMNVLHLGDAIHMAKEGTDKISFRLESDKKHKHTFQAGTQDERNGWLVAIESASEQAKSSKKEVESSEGYHNTLKELKNEKPVAAMAAGGAVAAGGAGAAAVASHKDKEEPTEATEPAEPVSAARHSSSDDGKKSKSKSRSQSRNKRASIFGTLRGKKEERDEKKEAKKEEKIEQKPVDKEANGIVAEQKEDKAEEKEMKKEQKAEEKEIKKEEKTEDKEIKKEEAIAAENKKDEKALDKEVKKEEKSEEKAQKHEEEAAEKADKDTKKEEEAAESKKKHETEAGLAGGAAVAAGGAAAAASQSKKDKDAEKSAPKSDTSKSTRKPRDVSESGKSKRRSGIFGMFDKSKSSDKKSQDALPAAAGGVDSKDVFAEDPVSAKPSTANTGPKTTASPAAASAPVAPTAAEEKTPAPMTKTAAPKAGPATPAAAALATEPKTTSKKTEIPSTAEPTTTTPAAMTTTEAEKVPDSKTSTPSAAEKAADNDAKANRRQSWFGRLGSMRSKSPRESKKHERKPSTTTSTATGTPAKPAVIGESSPDAIETPATNGTTAPSEGLTNGNTTSESSKLESGQHLATTQRLMGIDGKDEAKPLDSVIANGTPVGHSSESGVIGDVVPEAITRGENVAPASKEVAV